MTPVSNGAVELMIHFDQSYVIVYQNNREHVVNNYIVGLNDATSNVKLKIITPDSEANGMIMRFTFAGVYKLLNIKIAELSNTVITLDDLFGYQGRQLLDKLKHAADNAKRIKILNDFFLKLLQKDSDIKHLGLDSPLKLFNCKFQKITVESLAECLNVSYRTLERRFKKEMSISPKEYLKVVRFNKVCSVLCKSSKIDFNQILLIGGYYDQAHFIHEFKEFMKITPTELLQQSNGNFYITRGFRME